MTDRLSHRRWDPVVKVTHWSIALAVLANAIVTEEGSTAHVWVGYALATIFGLRLLWGLIGTPEARFSAFLPSPRRALAHVQEIRSGQKSAHASHNPLGALMVYAIWSCLLVIVATGIAMAGLPGSNTGRTEGTPRAAQSSAQLLASSPSEQAEAEEEEERGEKSDARGMSREDRGEDDREEGAAKEIHEAAANLLYVLILLHIAGVIFETRRSGRQVVLAMLPVQR